MNIDFPYPASLNDEYFYDGKLWTFNGVGWVQVLGGDYSTKTAAETATIEESVTWLRTQGYTDVGDGGGALYKKVVSEPAHDGKLQSQDGAWWELSELNPPVNMFGATGDGVTDDKDAFVSAYGKQPFFIPAATTYKTSLGFGDIAGMQWFGNGTVVMNDGANDLNLPGNFVSVTSEPAINYNDYMGFGGDSQVIPCTAYKQVLGASSAGTPSSGYYFNYNLAVSKQNFFTQAGHNESLTGSAGRTNQAVDIVEIGHYGQGDVTGYFFNGVAVNPEPRVGVTSWLANPCVAGMAGQLQAFAAGVGLQGIGDINLYDNGFDVTAFGVNINAIRTNDTGDLECFWSGYRIQNQGTKPINNAFVMAGAANVGLDFATADFGTGQAAIALRENQRIYFDASTSVAAYCNDFGAPYLTHNSVYGAFEFGYEGSGPSMIIANGYVRSFWSITTDYLYQLNTTTEPATNATYASIYIDNSDGDLKVKFQNGTVKTIATN